MTSVLAQHRIGFGMAPIKDEIQKILSRFGKDLPNKSPEPPLVDQQICDHELNHEAFKQIVKTSPRKTEAMAVCIPVRTA